MEHVEFTIYDRYHLQLVWKGGKEWIERDLSGIFYLFPYVCTLSVVNFQGDTLFSKLDPTS